jgi:hypothetical protein
MNVKKQINKSCLSIALVFQQKRPPQRRAFWAVHRNSCEKVWRSTLVSQIHHASLPHAGCNERPVLKNKFNGR